MKTDHADFSPKGDLGDDATVDMVFSKRGCCFWIPCFRPDQSKSVGSVWWERIRTAENKERWWTNGWKALKKVREWSEVVAGPKWKTFIRRFNRNGRGGKQGKFQYDPMSYALNFDEGHGQNGNVDDDFLYGDFSTQYAVLSMSAKSSKDLDRDTPPLHTTPGVH